MTEWDIEAGRSVLLFPQGVETGRYVERGRLHRWVDDQRLQERWAKVFRRWIERGLAADLDRMKDFGAELHLRGLGLPTERVPDELRYLRSEIERAEDGDPLDDEGPDDEPDDDPDELDE